MANGAAVGTALRAAARRLDAVGGTGRLDATLLLEHVTGRSRTSFVADGERALAPGEARRFADLVERRATGVPVAYLVGSAGFYGRTFAVDERVLVPRPETEHLIEAALTELRARPAAAPRVADVGTGSGAIAVTIAAEAPRAHVVGSDLSEAALAVARHNARTLGVAARCTFVCGDLGVPLEPLAPFDLVLANLPYVPTADVPQQPDPVGYEPRLALDGGRDGLALYRRLIARLPRLLAADGSALCEAAPDTVAALAEALAATLPTAHVEIGEDYAGLERFVHCTLVR